MLYRKANVIWNWMRHERKYKLNFESVTEEYKLKGKEGSYVI